MENRVVTFPQTQTILNGINVPNVQLDDIQAILNMRDAWKYLLQTVEEKITFTYWFMTITDKYMEQFNVSLLEYYNTGKPSELKKFLYDNAIHGINL